MRHIIVGRNIREAMGYAMRCKEESRGHQVRLVTSAGVEHGALRGLGGDDTEVILLPGAWLHPMEAEALEANGVHVITVIKEGQWL